MALVLAGGAVSGGAFKVGGLKALDDFLVGRRVNDLDLYVGLSAGSVLAVPLAAGITPNEMVHVLDGTSRRFRQLRPLDFYHPNLRELVSRPASFAWAMATHGPRLGAEVARSLPELPGALAGAWSGMLRRPGYASFERLVTDLVRHVAPSRELPSIADHIPSGLFDSAGLERWLRTNLERIRIPNDFRGFAERTGRDLFVCACNLDTAQRVVFGPGASEQATVSQAVQASTALPGFYKPARIGAVDYVDGGVRHTANIDVAIERGADLVICYNPFRPFVNDVEREGSFLSDRGLRLVLNQTFRTLLHSRLELGIQRYLNDHRFQGDIVLLEPTERDARFFALNPLAFWRRGEALQHGFESVWATIDRNFEELADVLGGYGLEMSRDAAARRARRVRKLRGWTADVDPVAA
ncbi:MAG: patatin-like phospholipase family protein [Myxococcales bacterium]|nr:patatin-like phospholipase family protein [Myxococcales bacterium]